MRRRPSACAHTSRATPSPPFRKTSRRPASPRTPRRPSVSSATHRRKATSRLGRAAKRAAERMAEGGAAEGGAAAARCFPTTTSPCPPYLHRTGACFVTCHPTPQGMLPVCFVTCLACGKVHYYRHPPVWHADSAPPCRVRYPWNALVMLDLSRLPEVHTMNWRPAMRHQVRGPVAVYNDL